MQFSKTPFFLIPALLLFALLLSCTKERPLPAGAETLPSETPLDPVPAGSSVEHAPGNEDPPSDSCSGSINFITTYTVLSSNLYPQYDLTISITPTTLPQFIPNSPCGYIIQSYCVTFNFPREDMDKVHLVSPVITNNPNNNPSQVVPGGSNVSSAPYSIPVGIPILIDESNSHPNQFTVCIKPGSSMIIGFKFEGPPPPGFTASNAILLVHGIATIDNIPDPEP